MPRIELIGVYPVEAEEPVHLIEIWVRNASGVFNVGGITQEVAGQPRSNWQAPYMEYVLNSAGDKLLTEQFEADRKPELWQGDMHMVFFFHYLDPAEPLLTPFGEVGLPLEADLPDRLSMVHYEAP